MRRIWIVYAAGIKAVEVFGDTITVVLDSTGIKKVIAELPSFCSSSAKGPKVIYSRGGAEERKAQVDLHSNRSNPPQSPPNPPALSPAEDSRRKTRQGEARRRVCSVAEVSRRLSEKDKREIQKRVEKEGGRVGLFASHTLNGVAACGVDKDTLRRAVEAASPARVVKAEENKKYHLSYLQRNVPDNFYLALSSQKRVFSSAGLNYYFSRYVRNSYLLRKSVWFRWYRERYMYASGKSTGKGVEIHVVDGGMGRAHKEVEGRVEVKHFLGRGYTSAHSTAVITAAAGRSTGLAKDSRVTLYPVFSSSTEDLSEILRGLEEVAKNLPQRGVVLLPFSGDASEILDGSLAYFAGKGISVVAAAGNEGDSSCRYSPGRSSSAITVGSISDALRPSAWSNTGSCTDAYYPGAVTVGKVEGAGKDEYTEREGTSVSAAAAAGYIAQLIEQRLYTPEQIKRHFLSFRSKIVSVPQEGSVFPSVPSAHRYSSFPLDCVYLFFLLLFLSLPLLVLFKRKSRVFVRYRRK